MLTTINQTQFSSLLDDLEDGLAVELGGHRTHPGLGERHGGPDREESARHGHAHLAGLRVGRFELTRAQYAAYDPKYEVPAGTGNHPASGISFCSAASMLPCRSSEKTSRVPSGERRGRTA